VTAGRRESWGPVVAAAVILVVVIAGWFAMPHIMLLVSEAGGGPLAGTAVAIAFILAFFGVLWLRARHQRRRDKG
jgi:hypothetical protein